jgi:hypothetical protein
MLTYDIHHDYTGTEGTLTLNSYWYVNGALVVTEGEGIPLSDPGAVYPANVHLFDTYGPETTTYTFEQLWATYLNGTRVFESRVQGTCTWFVGGGWEPGEFTVIHNDLGLPEEPAEETVVEEPVPGCDVSLTIPSGSVVGAFVADANTYYKPGNLTNPVVTIPAGNTAWVIGKDASGAYYKIIWVCQYLWVPFGTMGPNYDAVWNGTPLPTGVVE